MSCGRLLSFTALITGVAAGLPARLGALTHFSIKGSCYFILRSFNIFGASNRALKYGCVRSVHIGMWQDKSHGALSVEKKPFLKIFFQIVFPEMFPPLASRAHGINGCSAAPQAPVQPAQETWQGCWSCSLGPGAWDRLPPVPHSRSTLHPLFHHFSPLEIRCVWLAADGVHLVSAAADLCHEHSALMSRWWWRGGCVSTEWAFLKKKKKSNTQLKLTLFLFF